MSLQNLTQLKDLKFILFGGKGGVGKTTTAVAAAIHLAEHTGKKILIISTDPAHSLADSLDLHLQLGNLTHIPQIDNLWALEIDPRGEQSGISSVLSQMPNMEQFPLVGDLSPLTELNPPGLDEAIAFGKVLEYINNSEFDMIIFDTAPTGHTLKLLSIPDMLSGWLGKILMMKMRLNQMFSIFKNMFASNESSDGTPLDSLKKLKSSIELAREILQDPKKTQFVICMIAEDMAIFETERLLSGLAEYQIPSQNIIVNQLVQEQPDCRFCANRRKMQQTHLDNIHRLYQKRFNIIEVPLFEREIREIENLRKYSQFLF